MQAKSRIINITSNEEKEKFEELLNDELNKLQGYDRSCENFLDSEFNKIFVTYMYPDVTKIQ